MTLKNNRPPLLCCFKLYASFHIHRLIQTKVTVWKHSIRVKIGDFFYCVTLKFDGWPWKTIGHLSLATSRFLQHIIIICEFKLELTVRKRLSWVMTSMNLAFDLWPELFAWTSLLSLVITHKNFVMLRWQKHSEKGVTDRQTDKQTDKQTDRKRCS